MHTWSPPLLVQRVALLLLCAAYLQGGIDKAWDFPGAVAETMHFGLPMPTLVTALTIVIELGASVLIIAGFYRWPAALVLAAFTLVATFLANRFWELPLAQRFPVENAFFEHLGLVGGFLLVAWHDLRGRRFKGPFTPS
ncbi:MAG TPA: DoxX family protein [Pinirhizobacter sp.]|uniref:DoxX family protein n=1 Tax=Pinirhizobacter sp. TaxID=2950432 RepID=UPI002C045EC7|nr:DoxX family protein [Pinirhizobacter sp.]HMH67253.1 DoxX family protein [Pinirhizobacter sp.]